MQSLLEITNDTHDISARVKAIDDGYSIKYNLKSHKFELHHNRTIPTKQLELPYSQLTKQTVDYVLRTRADRIIEELKAIEEFNEKLEEKNLAKVVDKASYLGKDIYNYINHGGKWEDTLPPQM